MDGSEELFDGDAINKAQEQYKSVLSAEQSKKDADWRTRIKSSIIIAIVGIIGLIIVIMYFGLK